MRVFLFFREKLHTFAFVIHHAVRAVYCIVLYNLSLPSTVVSNLMNLSLCTLRKSCDEMGLAGMLFIVYKYIFDVMLDVARLCLLSFARKCVLISNAPDIQPNLSRVECAHLCVECVKSFLFLRFTREGHASRPIDFPKFQILPDAHARNSNFA